MSILVVDDEEMIRHLAQRIIGKTRHSSILADCGEEALKILINSHEQIDLVILDQMMPGLSGIDTLRSMRSIKATLPCILSSGSGSRLKDVPENLRTNLYILDKPYRAQQLVDLVTTVLDPTSANGSATSEFTQPTQ